METKAKLTPKQIQDQLLRYFQGDMNKVKELVRCCNSIGFKISENIDEVIKYPEHFATLITYSDLGILGKLADSLTKLKGK